jgi:DNA polymerase-3 subunit delta
MQISPNQLGNQISKGLRSLYMLHGDEPLLIQEAADAIREKARQQGFTERSVFTVAGAHFDWTQVLVACGSMSLFADCQLIELRIPSGKPGKDGSVVLQQIAEQSKDNQALLILIQLPRLDKATQSSAWFQALDAAGISIKIDPVERNGLPTWIAQRLAMQGQHVSAGEQGQHALQFFADRVEGNLLAAYQEVQKLALLYPAGELSLEQIESSVMNVARYDVFKLSEAVLAGNAARVQRMLDGLQAEGESEVLVHFALAEDIRNLKRVKDAIGQGRPLPMALRENRVWGLKERLFERVLPRLTQMDMDNLLHAAHIVDGVVKGVKSPDWPAEPWVALNQLALMFCRFSAQSAKMAA